VRSLPGILEAISLTDGVPLSIVDVFPVLAPGSVCRLLYIGGIVG
jgi:hypothetical protein